MSISELWSFLMPHDDFQCLFLALILTAGFGNAIAVWRCTRRPDFWEFHWDKCNFRRDAEPDSIFELNFLVSTSPERLAEIMPSILLAIGLLGTFLDLGVALNKASIIEVLGANLNALAWGILGFLIYKIWAFAYGYKGKRLAWCIYKFKEGQRRKQDKKMAECSIRFEANPEPVASKEPCPCGSGRRFENCHGRLLSFAS
jgi:hypothetical protein